MGSSHVAGSIFMRIELGVNAAIFHYPQIYGHGSSESQGRHSSHAQSRVDRHRHFSFTILCEISSKVASLVSLKMIDIHLSRHPSYNVYPESKQVSHGARTWMEIIYDVFWDFVFIHLLSIFILRHCLTSTVYL